jgi:integrase
MRNMTIPTHASDLGHKPREFPGKVRVVDGGIGEIHRRDPRLYRLAGHRRHPALQPCRRRAWPHAQCQARQTTVLSGAEARRILDSIADTTPAGLPDLAGLRDRALIGLMVYSFPRIGAAVGMRVEDVYEQQSRLWVRLHEKEASATTCRATTISKSICAPTWRAPTSPASPRRFCSRPPVHSREDCRPRGAP